MLRNIYYKSVEVYVKKVKDQELYYPMFRTTISFFGIKNVQEKRIVKYHEHCEYYPIKYALYNNLDYPLTNFDRAKKICDEYLQVYLSGKEQYQEIPVKNILLG